MKNALGTLILALFVFGFPMTSYAGRITTIDCNIDAYNLTGSPANDFDIKISGATGSQLTDIYRGLLNPFPNYTITDESYGVLLHFYGAVVPDGGMVHIGYEISPSGPIGTIDQYWSDNGSKLGGPSFLCWLPTNYRDGTVINRGATDVFVSRRAIYQPAAVDLQVDLLRGSTLWDAATLLDLAPIQLNSGASIGYAFPDMGHGEYVMMTDIFDNCVGSVCNRRLETVFTAVNYVPEPGILALFALGLAGFWGSRRKHAS